MFSKVLSGATFGIDAYLVEIETQFEKQFPSITIVGLPDNAIKESKERVLAAIRNTGIEFPLRKITINMAPADIKKEGSSFDLPIAIGMLVAAELIKTELLEETFILGELSLDGSLRKIKGGLPITVEARRCGIKRIILPIDSVKEASIVDGIEVYGMQNTFTLLKGFMINYGVTVEIKYWNIQMQKIMGEYSPCKKIQPDIFYLIPFLSILSSKYADSTIRNRIITILQSTPELFKFQERKLYDKFLNEISDEVMI
jgi:hypothetical protein